VLVVLRVEVPQALELHAQVLREPVDADAVDLDEVAPGSRTSSCRRSPAARRGGLPNAS
jgi:hypothetical protein